MAAALRHQMVREGGTDLQKEEFTAVFDMEGGRSVRQADQEITRAGEDSAHTASDGNLLITNHIHNTVIRLDPSTGKRTAIAGPDQGMAGSTACAFGTAPGDRASLFVTTTGGIVMPLDGVVQEAKLVRLETGVTGQPVTFRSAPRR